MNDLLDGDGLVECGDCGDVTNDFRVNIDTYGIICHPCWLERRAERAEADLAAALARAEAAEQRVAELEAAQAWRPVGEKPPGNGHYLGWDGRRVEYVGYWPSQYPEQGSPWVDEVGLDKPITHWRPLPPPPDTMP